MTVTKQQLAFYRKLFLADCLSRDSHSLTSLMALTSMPRRTLQDCLKSMADIGIICEFVQRDGGRNNDGHFAILDWGPIDPEWVRAHVDILREALGVDEENGHD